MKSITSALAAHLAGDVTTLAMCWKLTRKDSLVLGFTSLDVDLVIDGLTYHAASGVQPSAVASTAGLEVDNLDVAGLLDSSLLTEADLLAGRWDGARIEVFLVNWKAPADGKLVLRTGFLGEATVDSAGRFSAEVRGLSQLLQQPVGSKFSKSCRATCGDARCGVNLAAHTVTGVVEMAYGNRVIADELHRTEASGFRYGLLTFTSGACSGLAMEVIAYVPGIVSLLAAMPEDIEPGDTYTLSKGCDRSLAMCRDVFNNVPNFRGEPHIPNTGTAMAYPIRD